MASINMEAFREQERLKNITGRRHPTHDLIIWNYTVKCQYDQAWNDVTLQARGLITLLDGTIVARPFKKFFNLEEHKGEIPLEPFKVTTKFDGSLGILYFLDGRTPRIATRGSFTNKQTIRANAILKRYQDYTFLPEFTYLFEIIYPENRIVVDYGTMEDLVLLAVIHTETGKECDIHQYPFRDQCPFPVTKVYDGIKDVAQLRQIQETNAEGFVIRFESGLRLKCKFAEYKRLSSLFSKCTARKIWEYLKEDRPLQSLLECVPDEFYAWVKSISKELSDGYRSYHRKTLQTYKAIVEQAKIATPIAVGNTLTPREVDAIKRAMDRYMHEQFTQYPDIAPFLEIWHTLRPVHARPALEAAIWDKLYPPADIPPFRGEEET